MTREEFKKLFDKHFDAVRSYIYYRCGDTELATDIAQDTFMRVWEKQFSPKDGQIVGLLYKIASDFFVSRYRKQTTAANYVNSINLQPKADTIEQELAYKELKASYEKALAKLPEKQRTVFLMSRMDELKYHEIAERLGISVKAVEKRMKNALDF
ncbi:MAG: sigma-70 family RNA polymerase sigma factor, partial [Bacteroidales bacterium]|nr:sigma-70 family RNA polymerase sigma factor [Bacteroidales bacterium]